MRPSELGHPYTSMCVVVVHESPEDFPGQYVARRQWVHRDDEVTVEAVPVVVAAELSNVRSHLPDGLVRVARTPDDPPQVVEMWI